MAFKINDKKLKEALEIFGKEYIEELGNNLLKLDKKASGELLRSLDSRVITTAFGTRYTIEILGADYLKFVDEGRRAGKQPPLSAIRRWVRLKGINEASAYPIARSIGERGIKATNVIEKTLRDVNKGRSFRKLEDGLFDWVDEMVDNLILDLSKNKNITVK